MFLANLRRLDFSLCNCRILQTALSRTFFDQLGCHHLRLMETQNQAETSFTELGGVDGSKPNDSVYVARVKKLLFRRMLVGANDGRFFLGNFYCLDKQGNIILQDAVEYRSMRRTSPSPMEQRCLGLILIPSSCRTTCHVDCSIDEHLSLLSLQEQK